MRRTYSVVQAGQVLGATRLEHADRSMGVVHGPFVPTARYAGVQEVFRRFSGAQGSKAEAAAAAEYSRNATLWGCASSTLTGQLSRPVSSTSLT